MSGMFAFDMMFGLFASPAAYMDLTRFADDGRRPDPPGEPEDGRAIPSDVWDEWIDHGGEG